MNNGYNMHMNNMHMGMGGGYGCVNPCQQAQLQAQYEYRIGQQEQYVGMMNGDYALAQHGAARQHYAMAWAN